MAGSYENYHTALLDEIEALKAEVHYLKSELGLQRASAYKDAIERETGLSPQCAFIVSLLWSVRGRSLTRYFILENMPGRLFDREAIDEKIIDVQMCRIRRVIPKAFLRTIWGRGYCLTNEGIDYIDRLGG